MDPGVSSLADLLRSHDRIMAFTGAGISTSSGIPDYRGPQGVWKTRRPVMYQDFMSSPQARSEYWQQKLEDRDAFGTAAPNEVHRALVRLEEAGKVELVVTQNVDGLHRAAGTTRLVEVHGTNAEIECQSCGARSDPEPHFAAFADNGIPPDCECGGHLKPATISFGQSLRREDLVRAFTAAEACDMALALGSTLSVHPAAEIPLAAVRRGVPYAVVNRGPTDHDHVTGVSLRLEGDVTTIVPPAVSAALA